jgi:hypothetical protein
MRSLPFQLVGCGLLAFVVAGCAGLPRPPRFTPPAGYTDEQIRRDMSECRHYTSALGSLDFPSGFSSGNDAGTPNDMTVHRIRGGHGGGHGGGHHGHGRGHGHGYWGYYPYSPLWWAPGPYYWNNWTYKRCMQDRGYKMALWEP